MIVAGLAINRRGRPSKNPRYRGISHDELAELAGVATSTLELAIRVRKEAEPELIQKVLEGKLSLPGAKRQLDRRAGKGSKPEAGDARTGGNGQTKGESDRQAETSQSDGSSGRGGEAARSAEESAGAAESDEAPDFANGGEAAATGSTDGTPHAMAGGEPAQNDAELSFARDFKIPNFEMSCESMIGSSKGIASIVARLTAPERFKLLGIVETAAERLRGIRDALNSCAGMPAENLV
jgi:hypothetical protein